MTQELENILKRNGYVFPREVEGRGVCALQRFIFTTGLCYGLNEESYEGRYCFESGMDAKEALGKWDGVGDPPGNWIKHKGKIEYSNPQNK